MMLFLLGALLCLCAHTTTATFHCSETSDCKNAGDFYKAFVCKTRYDFCAKGICTCPSHMAKIHWTEMFGAGQAGKTKFRCVPKRYPSESCEESPTQGLFDPLPQKCVHGVCKKKRCSCRGNKVPTNDGLHCKKKQQSELGEPCAQSEQCFSKNVRYIPSVYRNKFELRCYWATKTCDCPSGFHLEKGKCILNRLDSPCVEEDNCKLIGGICAGGQCKCLPWHKRAVLTSENRNFEICVDRNAKTYLNEDQKCNSHNMLDMPFSNKSRICAPPLECIKCREWNDYKCKATIPHTAKVPSSPDPNRIRVVDRQPTERRPTNPKPAANAEYDDRNPSTNSVIVDVLLFFSSLWSAVLFL